jgi:hypothetical protein
MMIMMMMVMMLMMMPPSQEVPCASLRDHLSRHKLASFQKEFLIWSQGLLTTYGFMMMMIMMMMIPIVVVTMLMLPSQEVPCASLRDYLSRHKLPSFPKKFLIWSQGLLTTYSFMMMIIMMMMMMIMLPLSGSAVREPAGSPLPAQARQLPEEVLDLEPGPPHHLRLWRHPQVQGGAPPRQPCQGAPCTRTRTRTPGHGQSESITLSVPLMRGWRKVGVRRPPSLMDG